MDSPGPFKSARWSLLLAVCLLTGCSVSGNGLTFFPERYRLLDSAKAVRQFPTEPLPLPRELDKRALPPYVVEPSDVLLVQPTDLDNPIRLVVYPILPLRFRQV